MIDSSLWHTDLERVKDAVSGLPYLVKYSERDHLDDWVHNGTLRIRNAVSFAADKSPEPARLGDNKVIPDRPIRS